MCGIGEIGADNCEACTWPYSIDGWKNFRLGLRRISIDKCCVNAKQQNDFLNKLKEWDREGKIDVQKATTFLKEPESSPSRLKKGQQIDDHPPLTTFGSSINGRSVLGGPDLAKEIKSILFPRVKDEELQQNEKQDIQHLREHVRTGGHIFVTLDKTDFIKTGKQDALRRLGVWVCTPQEAVELVKRVYGFS